MEINNKGKKNKSHYKNKINKSDEENSKSNSNKDIKNEPNISLKLVEQRNERQEQNNNLAYKTIKKNPKKPSSNNINEKALDRLLKYTNYENLDEMIEDEENYKENILKLASLYIAKNASRQGIQDEDLQLENINTLQEYGISIIKDGKQKPIKGGGIRKSGKKQADELKSIDFSINYKDKEIGLITAKVTSGGGGHQDNVLDELSQFCDWAQIQIKNNESKVYVILYDSLNTSKLFDSIKKKYSNTNIIFTNTKKFKDDLLNWFNNNYKK